MTCDGVPAVHGGGRNVKYIHYKGGAYELIGIGRDVATLEPVVIYKSCATGELWVRAEAAFFGEAKIIGSNTYVPNDRPVLRNEGETYIVRRFIPAPPEPK